MANPTVATPYYDPINHGWAYVIALDDGTLVTRSVLGEYGVLDSPADVTTLFNDYTTWIGQHVPVPLSQIDIDDKGNTKDGIA